MSDSYRYTTLIASLPQYGSLFGTKQTPLSRLKLDERLTLLDDEDRATLARVEALLSWGQQPLTLDDAEIIARAKQEISQLDNDLLRQVVEHRLELRTVVAALRRRQRGEEAPLAGEPWGHGRWTDHIRRHWHEPGFALEGVFPWVVDAQRLLSEGDTVAVERLLLQENWTRLGRAAEGHYFDLEAVVIWVLRWNIIARWTAYHPEPAARRFRDLVAAGLGDYAGLFES